MKKVCVASVMLILLSLLDIFPGKADEVLNYSPVCITGTINSISVELSARSAILMTEDGEILYGKNENERAEPASTTKIMTALLALEALDPNSQIVVPAQAVGIEGSSLYLKEGEKLTVREMVCGLMLNSGNDAAVALAIACAGSVEAFADMMNHRARSLSMNGTHFENPHGLSSAEHYTTAYDLALLTVCALKNSEFAQIVSTYRTQSAGRYLINHNKLLRLYDGAVGVKTGFTKSSGRTLVGAAQRDGLTLVSVTLNAPDDWNDHMTLFDAGFDSFRRETVAEEGSFKVAVKVVGGTEDTVYAVNTGDFALTLKKDAVLTKEYLLPDFVYAPVRKGDLIGEIVFYADGAAVATVPLTAQADIASEKINFWEKIFG